MPLQVTEAAAGKRCIRPMERLCKILQYLSAANPMK
jgi:hypothetical protein